MAHLSYESDTDDESRDTDNESRGTDDENRDSEASDTEGSGEVSTTFESWIAGASKPIVTCTSERLKSPPPAPPSSSSPSPSPPPSPSPSDTATEDTESEQDHKRKPQLDLPPDKKQKRPRIRLPIEKDRTIVQYTVFRTRRPAQRPVSDDKPDDGQDTKAEDSGSKTGPIAGARIVRVASFVDKHRANKHAAQILRGQWTPSARRVELDCNDKILDRDGMFSGYIELASGAAVSVYVDCETVPFSETGLAGFGDSDGEEEEEEEEDVDSDSDNTLRQDYAELLLRPRYDVFVFLRKPLDGKDGHYEMQVYDEDDEDAETAGRMSERSPSCSDSSSSSSSSSDESEAGENNQIRGPKRRKEKQQTKKEKAALPPSPVFSTSPTPSLPPPPPPPTTLWVPHHEGSFTTLATASCRLVEAFVKWTRPPEPPRLDAVFYHRDVIQPCVADLVRQLAEVNNDEDGNVIEYQWTPVPQLRYGYETMVATIAKSRLQGPLDLTGAFGRER